MKPFDPRGRGCASPTAYERCSAGVLRDGKRFAIVLAYREPPGKGLGWR